MRKRIKELASGKIDYGRPLLRFSVDKVELEVLEGQSIAGEFRIAALTEKKLRGIVYTTGLRMEVLTPQFDGEEAVIRYEFHSAGLHEGNIEKGYFYLICSQCEYSLSFVVTVVRPYAAAGNMKLKSLKDLSRVAETGWEEASRIFSTTVFRSIFREEDRKAALLYETLSQGVDTGNSLNEFLVGLMEKEQTTFSLNQNEGKIVRPEEDTEDSFTLTVTGYGTVFLTIESDHPAILPEKEFLTRQDLLGNEGRISYVIKTELLHSGRNLARIRVRSTSATETFTLSIEAPELTEEEKKRRDTLREIGRCRIALTEDYLSYRLKRIVTGEWARKTVDLARHLEALEPENRWYPLIQAQAFLVNKQRQEARWILDAFRKEEQKTDTPVYGYFLYLCTLLERESSYVDKVTREIEDLLYRYPENQVLFWVLLFLREDYCENDLKRLEAIRERCENGARSPFLYMEAYYQMWMDPYCLEHLSDFEIRVLYWAVRRKALSKELALRISVLADTRRDYHPLLYKLLCMAYDAFPQDDMVNAVCAYLIRTQHFSHRYFYWFERGIELNLRITGLAEAYLISMDLKGAESLPGVIRMYFQYSNALPSEKKAELFARITKERKKSPELFHEYRRGIESFALEEMRAGHVSEDLAYLYDELMQEGFLSEEIALSMEHLMFTCEAKVANPYMTALIIRHAELTGEQVVPIRGGIAYFRLYTNNYSIAAEDEDGRRYCADTAEITIKRLLHPGKYLQKCMELAKGRLPYTLYHLSGKEKYRESLSGERENIRLLMSSDHITEEYKLRLCPILVRLYDDYSDPEELSAYLRIIDGKKLNTESRVELTHLLIEKKMYTESYQMIRQFGAELIDPGKLVPLLSYKIEALEYGEDEFLVALTMEAFRNHKYNDIMLTYLCKYYSGPTEDMELVFRTAKDFETNTFELEERILVQALFSAHTTPGIHAVFESYTRTGGRQLVIEAFLNYFSSLYFVREAEIPEEILEVLLERLMEDQELTEICALAVLKYYASENGRERSEEVDRRMEELLSGFVRRDLYFRFYQTLPSHLRQKYQLYDKSFLEYRSDPGKRVRLHYALPEDPDTYVTEEMQNMYGGIFVKQFVLFFGESIQYYITEEFDGTEKVVLSDEMGCPDVYGEKSDSRYRRLNEVVLHLTLKEEGELLSSLRTYETIRNTVRREFRPL